MVARKFAFKARPHDDEDNWKRIADVVNRDEYLGPWMLAEWGQRFTAEEARRTYYEGLRKPHHWVYEHWNRSGISAEEVVDAIEKYKIDRDLPPGDYTNRGTSFGAESDGGAAAEGGHAYRQKF